MFKNSKKKTLFGLFLLLIISLILGVSPFVSVKGFANTTEKGIGFNDDWYMVDGRLKDAPLTYEMDIFVPEGWDTSKGLGMILGNDNRTYCPFVVIEVETYSSSGGKILVPSIRVRGTYDYVTSAGYCRFVDAPLPVGEWSHITMAFHIDEQKIYCYINGVQKDDITVHYQNCNIDKRIVNQYMAIGNDLRPNMDNPFKGLIGSVAFYSDVRTGEEILLDYRNGADINDKDILAKWEFDSSIKGKNVQDLSGKGPSLQYNKHFLTEKEMESKRTFTPEYTFAVVGDTQYMTRNDLNNGTTYVKDLYAWLRDSVYEKNIQYAVHVGDVTQNDKQAEWDIAYDAISQLDGYIPYTVARGNHDDDSGQPYMNNAFTATTAQLWKQYADGVTGGWYEPYSIINVWHTITVGEVKWLFLTLDYAPTNDVLDWANEVIASHPEHNVVIITHNYLYYDATTSDDGDTYDEQWTEENNNGYDIWNKLVSLHKNVKIVFSGHIDCPIMARTQSKGVYGNTVSQFLVDQQAEDAYYIADGNKPLGAVALFGFSADGKTVSVEWYSTQYEAYYMGYNQFTVNLESNQVEDANPFNTFGIEPTGTGTQIAPYLIKSPANLVWLSKQVNEVSEYSSSDYNAGAFKGKYFKQICDIDFEDTFLKSIGYYYSNDGSKVKTSAFGGIYDGGGYKIKNINIIPWETQNDFVDSYTGGLFGVVCGGTVKNIVLENANIFSRGVTGGVVGRTVAPTDGNATESFNTISNCYLTSSCNIYAIMPYNKWIHQDTAYGNGYHLAGAVGSIVGSAMATTIENCTSSVEFAVDGCHSVVGGIVGTAGYNTVVNNCSFTGGITLKENWAEITSSYGGIVGLVSPNASVKNVGNTIGHLKIANCYNSGYFSYGYEWAFRQETHWGGILGNAPDLYGNTITIIENCYNLFAKQVETINADLQNYYIGGLVGKVGTTIASLYITNSSSVEVSAQGGTGTNEYRSFDSTTAYNKTPVIANSVQTASEEDMQEYIDGIKLAILTADGDTVTEWLYGNGAPIDKTQAGNLYLNLDNGDVYRFIDKWKLIGNIKGENGLQGEQGLQGSQGIQGEQGIQGLPGKDGKDGLDGKDGTDGKNGLATVATITSGVVLTGNIAMLVAYLIRKKKGIV